MSAAQKREVFLLLLIGILVQFSELTNPVDKTVGQPWPLPSNYDVKSTVYLVYGDNFRFSFDAATQCRNAVIEAALVRYHQIIFGSSKKSKFEHHQQLQNGVHKFSMGSRDDAPPSSQVNELQILVEGKCEDVPSLQMSENYKLKIASPTSQLTAKSEWGILRGLETFSQIIYEDFNGFRVVNETVIEDAPRFAHRGAMIDTSRHFVSTKVIKKFIDIMAINKLNVFHWHVVDDQSFPYQSVNFPDLSAKGAYDPNNHIYTQQDVAEIIEHARYRGIRVIPEFDTPGHTQSWGPGQPDLLTKCYDKTGKFDGSFGPVDPTKNSTYKFLLAFMKELTEVFKDSYIHLGGDEVGFGCWKSNPNITAFMKKMGFGDNYSLLEQYYEQNVLDILNKLQHGYVVWQEVLDNGVKLRPDTVVHVWKGGFKDELAKVTKLGYRTLLSACWYLSNFKYGPDWKTFYQCDPQVFNGTSAQKDLVVGGEFCMWGEYIDGTNLLTRAWPRGSAIAERLWSGQNVNDPNKAIARLEEHRCRMISRGFAVEPISGPGFCKHEFDPRR